MLGQAKLLVVSGLLPMLTRCARCGAPPPLPAFSASAGERSATPCAAGADPVDARALQALASLVGRPLAEASAALPHEAAPGVERLVGLVPGAPRGQAAVGSSPLVRRHDPRQSLPVPFGADGGAPPFDALGAMRVTGHLPATGRLGRARLGRWSVSEEEAREAEALQRTWSPEAEGHPLAAGEYTCSSSTGSSR